MFAELGVPVIDTDLIAREVAAPARKPCRKSPHLARSVAAGCSLDRPRLRKIVLSEPARRKQLEAITHPRIRVAMEAQCRQAGGPYQVVVVPLLIESGLQQRVDRVLVVDCPEELQLERLMMRDGESATHAKKVLAAQVAGLSDSRVRTMSWTIPAAWPIPDGA
jgi:dephospho-CoA kinase